MPTEEERWAEFNRKLAQRYQIPLQIGGRKLNPAKYQAILDERKAKKTLE